ncbi:MAG: response regulator [Eubacteriales bacterium]|nr:response regulator [Eubacteriales bacterium]
MKILVVEDETNVREGIVSILQMNLAIPYKLKSCAGSAQAIAISEQFYPDLVITDIEMPDMSGLELIRRMKAKNLCSAFVILSGHDNFAYAQQAIRYGVVDYLLKPLEKEQLLDVIQKIYGSLHQDSGNVLAARPFTELPFLAWEMDRDAMPSSLQRIIRYMEKNYMKEISQQSISEELFFHTSYISSLINKYTDHNFAYLLDYIRIRKAVELLLSEPDLAVAEVGVLVGYSNERRLYAAFQRRLNMTPGDLRKIYLE